MSKSWKRRSGIVAAGMLLAATTATGASRVELVTMQNIITDATQYNGCLIKFTPGPETWYAGCPAGLATLGCDGNAGPTKSTAAQLYSAAQLGLVTNTKVYVRIYDTKPQGNPYCLVDRVDNTKIPN